jgi:hypothetical protein
MAGRKTYLLVLYIVALFAIFFVSYSAATAAFLFHEQLPTGMRRSWWMGYVLNFAAPLIGGAFVGTLLGFWIIRANRFDATFRGHFVRTFTWYAFSVWVFAVIYANRGNTDLGLWVQLIIWPLMGTFGALIVDLAMTMRRRGLRNVQQNGVLGG